MHFRAFQQGDLPALTQIVRETWEYDRFCSPKTADKLAKAYLYSCLAEQTYTQVALVNNIPVGIIMAKSAVAYRRPFLYEMKKAISVFDLLCSKEGRAVSQVFTEVEKIDQRLLQSCSPYDGELVFFAVSKTCRGMGIGKMLFQNAVNYMRSQKVSSFYLFTDTSCNYGFYEHQGMQRKTKQKYNIEVGKHTEKFEFYLYDYHFDL